jgi:hypothetical protein
LRRIGGAMRRRKSVLPMNSAFINHERGTAAV